MENTIPPLEGSSGSNTYKTIDEKLAIVNISIENALNLPELASTLSARGYTKEVLLFGKELYKKAENLHIGQKNKYGNKYDATDGFDAHWNKVDSIYSEHIGLARIILKNRRGDLEKLQANGKRKDTISGWISQAKAFYTNSLESADIKAELAKKGITEAQLKSAQQLVKELEDKEAFKYDTKGEAQNATSSRDLAIDELLEWHKDFIDTARIALSKTPQLLEKLGVSAKR